jgi:TrpR-related protein YerC/YecD
VRGNFHRKIVGQQNHREDFDSLYEAILQLKTPNECERFLTDICTPAELLALAERWRVALLLEDGQLSYRDIHERTGVSVTTIGRVARFLSQEPYQGYSLVIQRLKELKKKPALTAR